MRYLVLGPVAVLDGKVPLELGGAQPRRFLALLVASAGRAVPTDTIIDALWGDSPPDAAAGTLQTYVSRLRRVLEPERGRQEAPKVLVHDPLGYRLDVPADEVDHLRFEAMADRARSLLAAGDVAVARQLLGEALGLWRGTALVDIVDLDSARGMAVRLGERRLVALEDRIDADLALGGSGTLVGELTELVAAHPYREGFRARLALALYRADRQADALRAIEDARHRLREELGVDPGPALRELEGRILQHDPALAGPAPARRVALLDGPGGEAGSRPSLVGRGNDLGVLLGALDQAAAGACVAVVEGEPGIGKTRLAEEVAGEAVRRRMRVLWARPVEADAAPAFWPWLAPLRSLAASRGDGEVEPELTAVLGQVAASSGPPPAGPARFAVLEAVSGLLASAASHQALVLVFDDLQWADAASLELLRFVTGQMSRHPVLFLCTVRSSDVGRSDELVQTLASLARLPGARRLTLRGLDADAVEQLLTAACGRRLPDDWLDTITDRSDGNPFFATELARLVSGDEEGPAAPTDVPASVRDVVRRRIAQLPDRTVEVLQAAAVVGRDVELGVLAEAAGRSVDACLDHLEPAVHGRILAPVPDQPAVFRFSHALVREAIADDVPTLRRARLHQRVADALEAAHHGDDDVAEIVAEHLWAAVPLGVGRRAAIALERAAEVVIRRTAYEAAERLLERAVGLRRAGAGGGADDAAAEVESIYRLFTVTQSLRGSPAILGSPLLERAKEQARRSGRDDLLALVLWQEWAGLDTACDFARADPLAAQLLEASRTLDDRLVQALGRWAAGITCAHHGAFAEAAPLLDESASAAGGLDGVRPLDLAAQMRMVAPAAAACLHELVGDADDVGARFDRLAGGSSDRFGVALCRTFGAMGAVTVGDGVRGEREAALGLEADPDGRFTFWGTLLVAFRGCALILQHRFEEGLVALDAGLERYREAGVLTHVAIFLAHRAIALTALGRLDDAAQAVAEARTLVEDLDERFGEAVVVEADARLRVARGAPGTEIETLLDSAARTAEGRGGLAVRRRLEAAARDLAASAR